MNRANKWRKLQLHRGECEARRGSPNPASKRCPLLSSAPALQCPPPARLGPRRGRAMGTAPRRIDGYGEASLISPPSPSRGLSPDTTRSPPPLLCPSGSSFPPPCPPLPPGFSSGGRVYGGSCWVLGLSGVMDDGGEVRLVSKKGKKRPPAAAPVEREAEGRGRFHALWRDYHDLLKDTEAKKRRLQSVNRRKLGLLAEVKFLRKKYSSFAKDDSQQAHYRLKKRGRKIPSPVGRNDASAFGYREATTEVPSTSKNTNFDLNQDSLMNEEGADCQGQQDHSEPVKLEQAGVDEDVTTDVSLSVCRDTGNSPASDDKRTIAWQDRVALKV